jgi:hypothetical protein
MLVDVMESLPARDDQSTSVSDDAGVERALRSFATAIESEDSLFECESPEPRVVGDGLCSADFELRLRAALGKSRQLQFALVEKLVELLRAAGSAETLAARICLAPQGSGTVLRLRLEARGNSGQQARLRWGLGVAHVQQALSFTSRYVRQQISQSGAQGS